MNLKSSRADGRIYTTTLGNGVVAMSSAPGIADSSSGGVVVQGNFHNPSPFSYTINRWNYMRGRSTVWFGSHHSGYDSEGCIQAGYTNRAFNDLFVSPSSVYNAALSALNEQTRGSIDLSIDFVQRGQTLKMMNAVQRYRDYVLKVDWRSLAKQAASLRLEYVYGWRPMASTLYQAADESIRYHLNRAQSFKGRGREFVGDFKSTVSIIHNGDTPTVFRRSGAHMCEIKVLLAQQGFDPGRWTSLNPISIGYEAVPYSFVLDWFIDVGSYLRDVETALLYGNRFVGGYVTHLTACDAEADVSFLRRTSGGWTYFGQGSSSGRYRRMSRSLLANYPLPRLPTFKANLGTSRLWSAAALLTQFLGKSPKPTRSKRE